MNKEQFEAYQTLWRGIGARADAKEHLFHIVVKSHVRGEDGAYHFSVDHFMKKLKATYSPIKNANKRANNKIGAGQETLRAFNHVASCRLLRELSTHATLLSGAVWYSTRQETYVKATYNGFLVQLPHETLMTLRDVHRNFTDYIRAEAEAQT